MAETAKKTAAKKQPKEAQVSRDTLLRAAYTAATARLREQHREDFNALMVEETQQRKIEWAPKKTQEQKDREALNAILAEHPEWAAHTTVVQPEAEIDDVEPGTDAAV